MKSSSFLSTLIAAATSATLCVFVSCAAEVPPAGQDLVTVPVKLPSPTIKGTPGDLPSGPGIETLRTNAPTLPKIPKDAVNVALGKTVTSSVAPFNGTLPQITDGKKDAFDDQVVEFKKGSQWVQVDLGADFQVYAIALWHDHRYFQAFHDVIVQVSSDPEFKTGVTTLFNNDTDNSSTVGAGTDREYFEQEYGRVIEVKGIKGRYVRGYTRGCIGSNSESSSLNAWQELEVYAVPAK